MGFSIGGFVKKGLGFADKLTLGVFTGGQTEGTFASKLLKKAGLKAGDVPNLGDAKSQAEADELIKLAKIKKEKRKESKFLETEGQGLRRKASLQFGSDNIKNTTGSDGAAAESVRATGNFNSNRLVL